MALFVDGFFELSILLLDLNYLLLELLHLLQVLSNLALQVGVMGKEVLHLGGVLHLKLVLANLKHLELLDNGGVVLNLRGAHSLLLGKLGIVLLSSLVVSLLKLGVLLLHYTNLLHVFALSVLEGSVLLLQALNLDRKLLLLLSS
jgi:hypothetical protein